MKKLAVPGWIKSYACFILANWVVFTLFRGIFLFVFHAALVPQSYHELWETFYIGAKFDARLACALAIPLGLYFTVCAFWHGARVIRKGISAVYALLEAAVLLIYFADFAHYAYIAMRINYSIFKYSENAHYRRQNIHLAGSFVNYLRFFNRPAGNNQRNLVVNQV